MLWVTFYSHGLGGRFRLNVATLVWLTVSPTSDDDTVELEFGCIDGKVYAHPVDLDDARRIAQMLDYHIECTAMAVVA